LYYARILLLIVTLLYTKLVLNARPLCGYRRKRIANILKWGKTCRKLQTILISTYVKLTDTEEKPHKTSSYFPLFLIHYIYYKIFLC